MAKRKVKRARAKKLDFLHSQNAIILFSAFLVLALLYIFLT